MYTKSLLALVLFSAVASADRNLPVLFQYSQPSHSVAIYRGADLVKAQAAGLFGGPKAGAASSGAGAASSSYATPAPPTYPTTTTAAPTTTTTTTAAPTPAPYTPAPYTPAPVAYKPIAPIRYRPAPVVYKPAPVVYKPAPAPIVYKPAPVVYKPAPVVYKPAPVAYKPAPVAYKPAPVAYKPAPVAYKPAPAYKPYVDEYAATDAIYNYEYAVKDDYTSNDFGAKENRNNALTEGKYYVALPDGRLQTVTYTVDGYNGYVPIVEYSGEPSYPVAAPAPAYSA